MKKFAKEILCAALTLVIVLSFVGCGAQSLEGGVWYLEDGDGFGYRFGQLQETEDGREMGPVERVGGGYRISRYYYYFTGENRIAILKQTPHFSGDSLGTQENVLVEMELVEENGQKMLLTEGGDRYIYQED